MQDKYSEIKFHDDFVKEHGCYEVHPDREYIRIIVKSGILNERRQMVLDVGCGSGAFGLRLANYGFPVLGVDISMLSVKVANYLAKKKKLNADFLVADIEKMPLRNNSINLIFCGFVLHHISQTLHKVVQEIARISNVNAKLYLCEPHAHNLGCFIQYHFGSDRTPNEKALNPRKLRSLLSSVGFANIEYIDIGDLEYIRRENVTLLRKVIRKGIGTLLGIMNKLPFISGPFFIMRAIMENCKDEQKILK
jgi:SAM-dependent methyltransferase